MVISISKKGISKKINIIGLIILISGVILSIVFRSLQEMVYFLFAVVFLSLVMIISYKIRFFPSVLIVDNDELQIEYMSKGFFKRPPFKGSVNNLSISTNSRNDLVLKDKESVIAIIDSNSIKKSDKDMLLNIISGTKM